MKSNLYIFGALYLALVLILFTVLTPREILLRALRPVLQLWEQHFTMHVFPQLKNIIAITPISKTNGATATGNIDTLGADWLTLDVHTTTADTTTNKLTTVKLSESDDTVVTNFADITAFVGGGAGGFTIPAPVTQGDNVIKFNIDLRARKRYIKVTVTPPTTQTVTAIANLGTAEQAPVTATKANVNALVEG